MSQKDQFFGAISTILNTSIKTVAYLMYHLAFHHWSKFQTKLTTFRGVIPPKKGGTYTSPLPPPLFLKSYFAKDIFLKIRFCVILQIIQNILGPDNPKIWLGTLRSCQKSTQKQHKMRFCWYENVKLEKYKFDINKSCLVCVPP